MDMSQLFSSLNVVAMIALVITILVLLFELRHVFFRKRVTKDPVIPDFDGNVHALPGDHSTHLDVAELESGGVNKVLIIILLGIISILAIILLGGFLLNKQGSSEPTKSTNTIPTIVPTAIIPIVPQEGIISPTSPFAQSQEVPYDLSGTPILTSSTPTSKGGSLMSPTSVPGYTKSPTVTSASSSASVTTQTTFSPAPTLPISGNYTYFIMLTAIPIVLLGIAILL